MEKNTEERHAGHVIDERLKAMKKSMYWLAGECNVSNNAVRLWVRTGKISRKNLPVIATSLGISATDLLSEVTPTAIAPTKATPTAIAPANLQRHIGSRAQPEPQPDLQTHYITAEEFAMIDVLRRTSKLGRSLLETSIKAAAKLIEN